MRKKSGNTPLEIYHGVPKGWYEDEIIATYRQLGGTAWPDREPPTEPGAPSWLPERYHWLAYRAAIRIIAELTRAGDGAAAELAIRYIELNYFGSYSGYLRSHLARALKYVALSHEQQQRLLQHFTELIRSQNCFSEFHDFRKLAQKIRGEAHV